MFVHTVIMVIEPHMKQGRQHKLISTIFLATSVTKKLDHNKSKIKRKKKIAAAIYEYQADCDGEWGKISFDFESSTAEIIHLADWDTIKTNRFANKAVAYLLNCENEKLPKETMVAFEP